MLFEREVINKEQIVWGTLAQLSHDNRQIAKILLAHLNQAQTLVGIPIHKRFDRRGFARTRWAVEQHILSRQTRQETLDILSEPCLLPLLPHQSGKLYPIWVGNAN